MKALIVVDMQNDFIDGALGTPEAEAIVEEIILEEDMITCLMAEDRMEECTEVDGIIHQYSSVADALVDYSACSYYPFS